MINTSAVGVSLLFLIAAATTVGSSSASHDSAFLGAQPTLEDILTSVSWQDALQAYHRQTNTVSLNQEKLEAPHLLRVVAPEGATFQGQVVIDDEVQLSLDAAAPIDLRPYLQQSKASRVIITGTYNPGASSVVVRFEGPETLVQQKTGEAGQVNFQLNLVVK